MAALVLAFVQSQALKTIKNIKTEKLAVIFGVCAPGPKEVNYRQPVGAYLLRRLFFSASNAFLFVFQKIRLMATTAPMTIMIERPRFSLNIQFRISNQLTPVCVAPLARGYERGSCGLRLRMYPISGAAASPDQSLKSGGVRGRLSVSDDSTGLSGGLFEESALRARIRA